MTTLTVPELGDIAQAEIIEILVKVGDTLSKDQIVMTLESDKALLEVPASHAGTITEILVRVGQAVKSGDALMQVSAAARAEVAAAEVAGVKEEALKVKTEPTEPVSKPIANAEPTVKSSATPSTLPTPTSTTTEVNILVPELGDIPTADVVDILIKVGDEVALEQTLVTLESDKALLEVPANYSGRVLSIAVKPGQSLKTGDVILQLATKAVSEFAAATPITAMPITTLTTTSTTTSTTAAPAMSSPAPVAAAPVAESAVLKALSSSEVYAGPAVRRLATQLGVDLSNVAATGPRGRLLKEDVHGYVKQRLQAPAVQVAGAAVVNGVADLPVIDFSQWGSVEEVKLNGIQKKSAQNLTRAWQMIPHVTQCDLADITDLEAFRKSEAQAKNLKLTMLAFLVKVSGYALQQFPKFKSSLQNDGSTLVMKRYCHIGIAVDTPNGLLVPVIRDVEQKSVLAIAQDIVALSDKAKKKQLSGNDMKGGCFTISSLGGIGGTGFTPIVNWPEVAILGVSRSSLQPVWQGNAFVPRLMLPLSLSYDHRVIDGADAARFTRYLAELLADIRRVLL
jgi:pyruvate dehydrogenase E2 component (dihydrolipoamide acetyltransferase)